LEKPEEDCFWGEFGSGVEIEEIESIGAFYKILRCDVDSFKVSKNG
jgi:hypothetical protein